MPAVQRARPKMPSDGTDVLVCRSSESWVKGCKLKLTEQKSCVVEKSAEGQRPLLVLSVLPSSVHYLLALCDFRFCS